MSKNVKYDKNVKKYWKSVKNLETSANNILKIWHSHFYPVNN